MPFTWLPSSESVALIAPIVFRVAFSSARTPLSSARTRRRARSLGVLVGISESVLTRRCKPPREGQGL